MGGMSTAIVTGNRKTLSAAKRAARHKQAMKEAGYVQANVWIPAHQLAAIKELAEALRADDDVTIGPLRRISNGRLVKAQDVIDESADT